MKKLTRTLTPRAAIILVHGMGDHGDALPYRLISEYMLVRDYEIYRFDLPGHGENINIKPTVKSWDELTDFCKSVIDSVCKEGGAIPVFLCGLSLGGLVALNYASKYPGQLTGVIAVSPALDTSGAPSLLQMILRIISKIIPGKRIDLKLDLKNIARDAVAVAEYTGDKLWQTKTSAGFAASVLSGIRETKNLAGSLHTPVLLLQGTGDKIVPNEGGAVYFKEIRYADKQCRQYPGFYHNLFLEPQRELVFGNIEHWIAEQIQEPRLS